MTQVPSVGYEQVIKALRRDGWVVIRQKGSQSHPPSIVDKANNWLGRIMSLAESDEEFELHVLLGKPREPKLQSAYVKAQNILHKMPTKHELVQESEAEQLAELLQREIEQHGG